MNILPIIPNLQTKYSAQRNNLNNRTVIQPKLAQALTRDTVSFSGGPNKISDFVAKGVSDNMDRLERIATTYLDVLESVAFRLKDSGFSFDRAYCEQHMVKTPDSYASKVARSGSFKVSDTIRASLYCNNLYDLDSLNLLLAEMKKRGYVIADTEVKIEKLLEHGFVPTENSSGSLQRTVSIPDLDVRLENIQSEVTKLPSELRYSIGKPQKSGYEDIQMRFVREFDRKKNPIQHELIILFGPNYSKAKHEEYENVYKHLRNFDELTMTFDDKTIGSPSLKANRYMDLIKQMFRGKVSEKLFLNAKNKDLYEIYDEMPISFSQTDERMFENYFSGLNEKLTSCYKEAKKGAKPSDLATKQLNSNMRHDKSILKKTQENLRNTIAFYNKKNGINELKD